MRACVRPGASRTQSVTVPGAIAASGLFSGSGNGAERELDSGERDLLALYYYR